VTVRDLEQTTATVRAAQHQRYGNTTAATIPMLLAEAEETGRLRRGMNVAMVAFGSGVTWSGAIVDW
jgi:3-oxoacyl-[acyl-carrier-protein] synthase-3